MTKQGTGRPASIDLTLIPVAGINPNEDYAAIQVDMNGFVKLSKQDREILSRIEAKLDAVLKGAKR